MSQPKTFKNGRTEVLARLREIKNALVPLINGFTVTSTVYEHYTQANGRQNARQVPRQYHEYPENKPENWGALYAEADRLTALASSLREFAEQQYRETIARNAAR